MSSENSPQKGRLLAVLRGVAAAGIVLLCGGFATLQSTALALAAGLTSFDLGRREANEPEVGNDLTGWGMQLGFLAILAAGAFENRNPQEFASPPGLGEFLGLVLIAGGLYLRGLVTKAMGEHFTVQIVIEEEHRLVRDGPFRRLRHPSYSSLLLIAIGTAIAVNSPLALGVALLVWLPLTVVRIVHEEKVLLVRFGDAYREYSSQSWRLIPGVY